MEHQELKGILSKVLGQDMGTYDGSRKGGRMNIQVQRMYRFDSDRPLKAFADIIIEDSLLIKGIKILEGRNGLFVSMPQEQAKDKKWYDSVRCLNQEIREQITQVVLDVYREDEEPRIGATPEELTPHIVQETDDDVIIP